MTSSSRPSLDELAAGPLDDTDARLLHTVAALHDALDPVPSDLVDRITFGITLDALHAEIAELQRSGDLVGARSDDVTEAQTITFTSPSLTTMVSITVQSADTVRIDGWVAPAAALVVELRLVDGVRQVDSDEDGRFVIDDVPRGLAQFVLRPASGVPVITPSIQL